eukprot:gene26777-6913_t
MSARKDRKAAVAVRRAGPTPPVLDAPAPPAPALLPPQAARDAGKPTVVFDLDETLVQVRDGGGAMVDRPHLTDLLAALRDSCELVLWTASGEHSAARTPYTKDLRLLGRDLDRTLIVENSADNVSLNAGNALMVEDWWGDDAGDESLVALRVVDVGGSMRYGRGGM